MQKSLLIIDFPDFIRTKDFNFVEFRRVLSMATELNFNLEILFLNVLFISHHWRRLGLRPKLLAALNANRCLFLFMVG